MQQDVSVPLERGPRVLRSKTAVTLYLFWAAIALLVWLPTPLRQLLLRRRSPAIAAPAPALPAARTEPVAAARPPAAKIPAVQLPSASPETSRSDAPQTVERSVAIEDPHAALEHVARALSALRHARPGTLVRVLHYGDSQIDLDHITAPLRQLYQQRYGDGGLGFVPVAKPWPWYYLSGVVLKASEDWQRLRLVGGKRADGRLGLGGLGVQSSGGGAWVKIAMAPRLRASRVELSYLEQPGGGTISVDLDGKRAVELSTAAPSRRSGFHRFQLEDERHALRLRTNGRVRLFGVTFERPGPGVTWENLALVGTRFHQLDRLEQISWREQLQRRAPDLVVFQFGANDAISYGGSLERYEKRVGAVLVRLRQALPAVSCLVLGPLDQLVTSANGETAPPPALAAIIQAQRDAALAHHCAFWNTREAMGGAGSVRRWIDNGMVRKDLLHLNQQGSAELARRIDRALQAALARYTSR